MRLFGTDRARSKTQLDDGTAYQHCQLKNNIYSKNVVSKMLMRASAPGLNGVTNQNKQG